MSSKFYDLCEKETFVNDVFFVVPPRVMLPAAVVRSLPGYKVWCSATGSPPIHIALIRNSTVLVNTTATAEISLYEDGNYTCVVTSRYGTNSSDFFVTFIGTHTQTSFFLAQCDRREI